MLSASHYLESMTHDNSRLVQVETYMIETHSRSSAAITFTTSLGLRR